MGHVETGDRLPDEGRTMRGQTVRDDLIISDEINLIASDEIPSFAVVESINTPSMQIQASDGIPLLRIYPDGRWVVDPERAPEAARIFLDEMVNYTERLREAERCVAAVRKVLFEDASLSHDDRLSKAAALLYAPQSAAQRARSDHHTPTEEKS